MLKWVPLSAVCWGCGKLLAQSTGMNRQHFCSKFHLLPIVCSRITCKNELGVLYESSCTCISCTESLLPCNSNCFLVAQFNRFSEPWLPFPTMSPPPSKSCQWGTVQTSYCHKGSFTRTNIRTVVSVKGTVLNVSFTVQKERKVLWNLPETTCRGKCQLQNILNRSDEGLKWCCPTCSPQPQL